MFRHMKRATNGFVLIIAFIRFYLEGSYFMVISLHATEVRDVSQANTSLQRFLNYRNLYSLKATYVFLIRVCKPELIRLLLKNEAD